MLRDLGILSLKKKIIFCIVAIALLFLLIFLSGEIIVRIISIKNSKAITSQPWIKYPGFSLHPSNSSFEVIDEKGEHIRIITDKYGLRNEGKYEYKEEDKAILVLGDSFIEADNIHYDLTLCRLLEKDLLKKGFYVINGGVNSYSNYQSFLLLEHIFDKIHPDIVLLMVFLGNDLRDNFTISNHYLKNKGNLMSEAVTNRLRMIARKSEFLVYLYSLFKNKATPFIAYYDFEIHTYKNNPEYFVTTAVEKTKIIMAMFDDYCKSKGVSLIVFGIPSKAQVYEEIRLISCFESSPDNIRKALEITRDKGGYSFDNSSKYYERICGELRVPYYSLLPIFRNKKSQPLYFKIDTHWSELGQQVAAKYVANILEKYIQ